MSARTCEVCGEPATGSIGQLAFCNKSECIKEVVERGMAPAKMIGEWFVRPAHD